MLTTNSFFEEYLKCYKPLIQKFIAEVENVKMDGLPQPFLPHFGELYGKSDTTKIAFIGMETAGWGELSNFIEQSYASIDQTLLKGINYFNELPFCDWGNNFGSSFWDFNFKFLANYYNLDWKKIKKRKETEVLKSFIWGNVASIERYHITSQEYGADYADWLTVKKASQIFDDGNYILELFKPEIMVILNWNANDSWLYDNLAEDIKPEIIDDHFWYLYLPFTKTHILWTAHPTWISKYKDFDGYIKYLVEFVKQKMQVS